MLSLKFKLCTVRKVTTGCDEGLMGFFNTFKIEPSTALTLKLMIVTKFLH